MPEPTGVKSRSARRGKAPAPSLGGEPAAPSHHPPSPGRKKQPGRLELDTVRIERQGDTAVLTPQDPGVAVTHLRLGPELAILEGRGHPPDLTAFQI